MLIPKLPPLTFQLLSSIPVFDLPLHQELSNSALLPVPQSYPWDLSRRNQTLIWRTPCMVLPKLLIFMNFFFKL